jgi:ubiquinone biosynthesis protein UbiJ
MLNSLIENVLNRGLPRSPRAQRLCAELAGRTLAVEIRGFGSLLIESTGAVLQLKSVGSTSPDARVSGGPLALLAIARAGPAAPLARHDVELSGDGELAQQFRELAWLLRPDLEEELALAIGDVPAHQIGRAGRAALEWGRRAADTAARNLAEFLAHERGDLVSRPEGRQLLEGIDALREEVDRLEARVSLIEQQRAR